MKAIVASTKSSANFLVLNQNPLDNLDTLFDIDSVYNLGNKVSL